MKRFSAFNLLLISLLNLGMTNSGFDQCCGSSASDDEISSSTSEAETLASESISDSESELEEPSVSTSPLCHCGGCTGSCVSCGHMGHSPLALSTTTLTDIRSPTETFSLRSLLFVPHFEPGLVLEPPIAAAV